MLIRSIRRTFKKISSRIIRSRIKSGKTVYFESPLEELAFRYLSKMPDGPGKYYAKYYGQDEFEINPDASSVYLAVNEGLLITKFRYNRFHLIEGTHWNRKIQTSAASGA